jgi:hypothetical protein
VPEATIAIGLADARPSVMTASEVAKRSTPPRRVTVKPAVRSSVSTAALTATVPPTM